MNIIHAEYNIHHNCTDIATTAEYPLRIDCWKVEKGLKTTPCLEYALNTLAIDEALEYTRLYFEGNGRKFLHFILADRIMLFIIIFQHILFK